MRRFAFRLEPILRVRRAREQEWEHRIAEVNGRITETRREMDSVAQEYATFLGIGSVPPGIVDVGAAADRLRYEWLLSRRRAGLSARLAEEERRREDLLPGYREAMQARMALEKLKERTEAEFHREVNRREQRDLDEVAARVGTVPNGGNPLPDDVSLGRYSLRTDPAPEDEDAALQ